MLAKDFTQRFVKESEVDKFHVIAHIDNERSWFHVHLDEEIPTEYPISLRYQAQ